MKYVVIKKLSQDSGLTENAIRAYRKKGIWREGVHWIKRQGRLYFNHQEIEKWIEGKTA
ncbi:MAG: DUF1233 family excisionase [Proteobacteria bacterium]|nr:excisionase [Pseudomonadota bacterium]NOG61186.1 DUF1233 family excisionase [Pseudomonadota bacterium]